MAENKMAQVAQMFGKKLGEEFLARIVGNKFEIKCRFAASGFQQTVIDGLWHDNDAFLSLLLTGRAEILSEDDWRVQQTLKDLSGLQGGDC